MLHRITLILGLTLLLVACGDSDDSADDAPTTTAPDATAAPAATDAPDAPTEGAIPVSLNEFDIIIDADAVAAGGTLVFEVSSDGEFPHEFGILRGTSYEDLPTIENGAIDEEALGDAILGKTESLDPGMTATIEFDLEAGDYVLFCNVNFGPNSHAANGQTLNVTVG